MEGLNDLRPAALNGGRAIAARGDKIRIFIVCRTRLYRDALTVLLAGRAGIEITGHCEGLDRALKTIVQARPDLVLVDASEPNGLRTVRGLAAREPAQSVVAFGVPETVTDVVACVDAGAVGYVLQCWSIAEAMQAIRKAASKRPMSSLPAGAAVARPGPDFAHRRPGGQQDSRLTTREKEVLRLVGDGLSNKEIGQLLSIQVATVKNHVHSILQKLELRRRGQVASWAQARQHEAEAYG